MVSEYKNKMNHFFGNPDSKINLEIYEDYECENCGKAFKELKALREFFKEEICLIYKHYPVSRMHPFALLAAQVVESCALQQKYIQAHDLILECQEFLEYGLGGIISMLKRKYAVSGKQLEEDLKGTTINKKIEDDIDRGKQLGIISTPAIFINGLLYKGAVKFDSISTVIKEKILENQINFTLDNRRKELAIFSL